MYPFGIAADPTHEGTSNSFACSLQQCSPDAKKKDWGQDRSLKRDTLGEAGSLEEIGSCEYRHKCLIVFWTLLSCKAKSLKT